MKPEKVPADAQPAKWWRWQDASSRKGLPEDYRPTSQKQRRRWVVTLVAGWLLLILDAVLSDFIALLFDFTLFTIGFHVCILMTGLVALITGLIKLSQDKLIMKTAQGSLEKLDERQRQVRLRASEMAYNIMIITAPVILLTYQLLPDSLRAAFGKAFMENAVFMVIGAIFLKHVIVAWLEPDPIPDDSVSSSQAA